MPSKHLMVEAVVLTMLCVPALQTETATPLESPYYDVIGIGCVPWTTDGRSLAWRMASDLLPPREVERLFKHFEGEDTKRCLASIVSTDRDLESKAQALGPDTTSEEFEAVLVRIHSVWTAFGVPRAMEEVAKTGKRGSEVQALLKKCEKIVQSSAEGVEPRERQYESAPGTASGTSSLRHNGSSLHNEPADKPLEQTVGLSAACCSGPLRYAEQRPGDDIRCRKGG